jgi:hypothetical protein
MTTTDLSQTGLREPAQVDWDSLGKSSSYTPPPPASDASGRPIVYYGVADLKESDPTKDGYLQVLLDPIKITRSGTADGYEIRFSRVSTQPFQKNGQPMKGNPNSFANFLRACQVAAKPQTNADYLAAAKATKGKVFPFTIKWEAYNKETGESIKGFENFPDDPERPGQKKSILKQGDVYTERDAKGNVIGTKTVQSEILFANAKLRFFQDPSRGTK